MSLIGWVLRLENKSSCEFDYFDKEKYFKEFHAGAYIKNAHAFHLPFTIAFSLYFALTIHT